MTPHSIPRRQHRRAIVLGFCPASLTAIFIGQTLLAIGHLGLAFGLSPWCHALLAAGDLTLLTLVVARVVKVIREERRRGRSLRGALFGLGRPQ